MPPAEQSAVLALLREQRVDDARQLCERMLRTHADNATLWGLLGVIYGMLGNPDKAERCFRQAIHIDPTYIDAYNNLGTALAMQNRLDEAIVYCRQALKLRPDFLSGYYNLAWIMTTYGRLGDAISWYEQAFKLDLGITTREGITFPRALAEYLCATPPSRWEEKIETIQEYGKVLERSSVFEQIENTLPHDVAMRANLAQHDPAQTTSLVFGLLGLLAFSKSSAKNWNKAVFEKLVLPWMQQALVLGHYDLALRLESKVYNNYIKQTETEEHFRDCFNLWVPAMREAGRRAGATLGPVSWPDHNDVPIVGFFLHNTTLLAHVEALLGMLEGWAMLDVKPFAPRVYAFTGDFPPMRERFAKLGVPVVLLDQSCPEAGEDWYQKLICLRDHCLKDKVTAIVWMSFVGKMAFAFSLRIAPVQIWWAMKYHSLDFPEIDGYLTAGSFARFVHINGRRWRSTRLQVANRTYPGAEEQARAIRTRYGSSVLLGTLAREEKIASPTFLDAVCRILRKHANTLYLWTGRHEQTSISEHFRSEGVYDQTRYLGWIDTKVYARVLDVFLDSFPAGCGFTVWETLAAKKPVVFMASDGHQENISLDQLLWPLLQGGDEIKHEDTTRAREILGTEPGSRYLRAIDTDDYIAHASRLVNDVAWRREVGNAGRRFVEEMMSNPVQTARDFGDHILEILQEVHMSKRAH